MKKVLFLSTALVATASMAAADVRISGYGRFGLDYNDGNGTPGAAGTTVAEETNITSRLRLQFDMSTETDTGITFGARYRAQAESRDGTPGGAMFNGGRFFASTGGLTVAVGNIIGAMDGMTGLYLETRTAGVGIDGAGFASVVGNIGGGTFDWDAYSSSGAGVNGLEAIYNLDNFGVHVSYSRQNDTSNGPNVATTPGEENTAISAFSNFGNFTVAGSYNDETAGTDGLGSDNDMFILSAIGDFGFGSVRLAYASMDNVATSTSGDASKIGLYGAFDIGAATTLVAYVTDEDHPGSVWDGTGYGLHVSYDLGGGVSFEAGVREDSSENTTFQAGVYFGF